MARAGGCYCGSVRYEADLDNNDGVVCACKTCQKLHTMASYNVKADQDKVKVTKGSPTVFEDNKPDCGKAVHRYFCGSCGSHLYSDPDSMPGVRFIKAGTLDDVENVKLAAEIYVETALPHVLSDKKRFGQKQFEGMMAKEV